MLEEVMGEGAITAEPTVTRHSFTVEEFHKMGEAGIFSEDDRVELVEGEVVEMSPVGRRHVWAINALTNLLVGWSAGRYVVSVQNPVVLGEYGEYQPDLAILENPGTSARLPTAEDVLLLTEVADTSTRYDRETKLPLYARSEIPEVWLVNFGEEAVEVHSSSGQRGYDSYSRVHRGGELRSATIGELAISDAAEILPSR